MTAAPLLVTIMFPAEGPEPDWAVGNLSAVVSASTLLLLNQNLLAFHILLRKNYAIPRENGTDYSKKRAN